MKWPLFENKIKDELSSHRSEVDVDALWSAIEPQVDAINQSKRKKRIGIIWFLLAGTLLLGSGAVFYFLNNSDVKNTTVVSDDIINEKTDSSRELNENKNDELKTVASNTIEQKTSSINNSETKSELNKKTYKQADIKNNPESSSEHKKADDQNKRPIANNEFINKSGQILSLENSSEAQPFETTVTDNKGSENTSNNRHSEPIQEIGMLKILPFKTKPFIPNVRIPALKNVLTGNPTTPEPSVEKVPPSNKKDFHFSVGVNGGISFSDRKLSAKDSLGNELLKVREPSEKQLETSHMGLQLNMQHRSGFEISGGFQYTRIVELYSYNKNLTTTDSIFGISYYAVNPNNDTIAVMGMVPHATHTDIAKRYYNRYTMLDIPVLIGFYKESYGWVYGAQVGVFTNISLKTKGRFLKSENEDEDIKNLFKNNVGISYYVSLSGGYKIGNQMEINLSPYLRYFPENFAVEGYPVSQKYMLIGLDARVRYWF